MQRQQDSTMPVETTTKDIAKAKPITARTIKARKIARGLLESKKYADIAADAMPHVENPAQSVYSCLQRDYVQAEIKEVTRELWSKSDIEKRAQEIFDKAVDTKKLQVALNSLELTAKLGGHMVEKREVMSKIIEKMQDLSQAETETLINELTRRLKASAAGVEITETADNTSGIAVTADENASKQHG